MPTNLSKFTEHVHTLASATLQPRRLGYLLAFLQISLYCVLSVLKINPTTLGIKFLSFSQDEQEKPECAPGVQKKVMRLPGVTCSR